MSAKPGQWRTIKPKPGVYIHVQKIATKGPRGGRTKAEHIRHIGSHKVVNIVNPRKVR